MSRRKPTPPLLRPVYVPPQFDRHEREALRAWRRAAYRGPRAEPKPGDFDPLLLRMGMRMHEIESRAAWVVSNPMLDETLRRSPHIDSSLPGPAWLREVYLRSARRLVALPGVRAVVDAKHEALRRAMEPAKPVACEPQGRLF